MYCTFSANLVLYLMVNERSVLRVKLWVVAVVTCKG